MVKIGFGVTKLSRGLNRNHIDGIGVYTQELMQKLQSIKNIEILPFSFLSEQHPLIGHITQHDMTYSEHVLLSQFFKKKLLLTNPVYQPQLIHAPDHLIPEVKNIPVIATVMDLIPFIYPEWTNYRFSKFKNWLFKNKILSADHIITISEFSKQDLIRLFDIPEDKISVTPLGMNERFYQRISEEKKQKVSAQYDLKTDFFLFIGTLQPRKNLEKALEAHSCLTPNLRKQHPFVIVGNAGWANQVLLNKIQEDEEKGYVRWLKYLNLEEVQVLLQSALALVYVSLYEGFGLPIVEAFASQCPVITSNVTSIPEVAGDAAIQVSPLDVEEILNAMENLINSSELRNQMIIKGLVRAKNFSWEQCAKDTLAVYHRFL